MELVFILWVSKEKLLLKIKKNNIKNFLETIFKRVFRPFSRLFRCENSRLSEEIKNEKYTIVNTKLIGTSDRPEVKIDWRVYTKDPENLLIRI